MWIGEDEEENPFIIRRGKPGTLGADTWSLKLGNNILARATDVDYLKAKAQRLQDVLDGEGESLRAERNAVIEEVVAKLETLRKRQQRLIDESDEGSGYWNRRKSELVGLLAAIAAVRSLAEPEGDE
jgi:hypothetical protein